MAVYQGTKMSLYHDGQHMYWVSPSLEQLDPYFGEPDTPKKRKKKQTLEAIPETVLAGKRHIELE